MELLERGVKNPEYLAQRLDNLDQKLTALASHLKVIITKDNFWRVQSYNESYGIGMTNVKQAQDGD